MKNNRKYCQNLRFLNILYLGILLFANQCNFPSLDRVPLLDLLALRSTICLANPNDSICRSNLSTPDITSPTIAFTTPTNLATNVPICTGTPCRARVVFQFSESMDTSIQPMGGFFTWNSLSFESTPVQITYVWSTTTFPNDTFTMSFSWIWFPENQRIQIMSDAVNWKDLAGNTLNANINLEFTTGYINQSYAISDTEQINCYDDTNLSTCPAITATFPRQDGIMINTPLARNYTAPTLVNVSDYITTDLISGLVWTSCNLGQTGPTCGGAPTIYSWANAMNACASYNSANAGSGYANRTDWRLPTRSEVHSLPNFVTFGPSMNLTAFPNPTTNSVLTLSGTSSFNTVYLLQGNVGIMTTALKSAASFIVRCVSSPTPIVTKNYQDLGDGTIRDMNSNLRWDKCTLGLSGPTCSIGTGTLLTWGAALNACSAIGPEWRLPNYNELGSLIDNRFSLPAIDPTFFPNTISAAYWTSTSAPGTTANAWTINMTNGTTQGTPKGGASARARCVRNHP